MLKKHCVWMVIAILAAPISAHADDVVNVGMFFCNSLLAQGVATECDVSGWQQSINMTIDTTSSEAGIFCNDGAKMIAARSSGEIAGWKVQIYSPYSGEHPIAACEIVK